MSSYRRSSPGAPQKLYLVSITDSSRERIYERFYLYENLGPARGRKTREQNGSKHNDKIEVILWEAEVSWTPHNDTAEAASQFLLNQLGRANAIE